MSGPYNPLDKLNLGRSVADALLLRSVAPLTQTADLVGAGVYAIYYTGNFEPYGPVAEMNRNEKFEQPIYVGKAVPKGARKGGLTYDASSGRALRRRLRNHAVSITEVANLQIGDFQFRSLVIDDIWIPLGENMMIELFKPIWNLVIDGFGNNIPGKNRDKQRRSPWDMLHRGRRIAAALPDSEFTAEMVISRLQDYFAGQVVPLIPVEEAVDAGTSEDEEE